MVALAAFLPSRDVYFVDFDRADKIERRRIERAGEAIDAPMDRFVCHLDFALQLPETRVKAEKRVNREQPPAECNLRVSEDRACLIVERTVAILTEIPLKL